MQMAMLKWISKAWCRRQNVNADNKVDVSVSLSDAA